MGCSVWCCESFKTHQSKYQLFCYSLTLSLFWFPSLSSLSIPLSHLLSYFFFPFYLPVLLFHLIFYFVLLSSVSCFLPLFFICSVRRLSAAASGEDFAQHGDGEGRRWLDGSGRVPGQKWSMQRWVMFTCTNRLESSCSQTVQNTHT